MAEEKLFTFSLRKEFSKAPNYKRTKKAVTALTELIARHMKVDINNVRLGKHLNLKLWEHGRKNPPQKIQVKSIIRDNKAYVELPNAQFEELKVGDKKKEEKHEETKAEAKEEQKKEDLKALEKEELKEMKKEHRQEIVEKPGKSVKQQEKVKEDIQRASRVIGSTGKKGAKEPKP